MNQFVTKLPKVYLLTRSSGPKFRAVSSHIRHYATKDLCPPPKPLKRKPTTGTAYTLGALALIGVGTIAYAKYDPEFRKWLNENVPGANEFFKFIFQEEKSVLQNVLDWTNKQTKAVTDYVKAGVFPEPKKKIDPNSETKEYIPPRPVFPTMVKPDKKEGFEEIRVVGAGKDPEIVQGKPQREEVFSPTHPKTLAQLEAQICDSAKNAIAFYQKALVTLRDFNKDVEQVVERSVERLDPTIWNSLKKKTEIKNEYVKEAEQNAIDAMNKLKQLEDYLKGHQLEATEDEKAAIQRTMDRYLNDIHKAQKNVEKEKYLTVLTEKYWTRVSAARCHFIDELEILFPGVDINNKKLNLQQGDLDLFLVHAFQHVLYYQKELHKIETIGNARIKEAMEKLSKNDPDYTVVEAHIEEEVEKEKRKLALDYQKKCLELRQEAERELRHRLKCQAEAHQDHMSDALILREQEMEREFSRKLDEAIASEQAKYKMQLAGMVGRMKGMRTAIRERVEADKLSRNSQVLWSACQALHRAVRVGAPGVSWKDQMKPLQHEIQAIRKAASDGDELVRVVLNGIPEEAISRGVFPEDAIRERFLKVERVAKRVALIPEEGGRLPLYFLSFLQSMLLIPSVNPIPQTELNDEKTDFSKLNTFEILQRARYYLDRGNYAQALRYMNLLSGASRQVACEWMKETRILLETQQAADTLMAHAVAGGLATS